MTFRKIGICLLIAFHGCSVLSQSDRACEAPNRQSGFCVAIERCRNIDNIVRSTTLPTRGVQNYIDRANCTLAGEARRVCCVPQEIIQLPEDCGMISGPKLAWAEKTLPFQYPWMVALRYMNNRMIMDLCGGSLISNRYVLTAAHCVQIPKHLKLYRVRLGEQDKSKPIDCIVYTSNETVCADPPVDVAIESTIVHGQYNASTLLHDIALIRMAQQVRFSDSIQPICLPLRQDVRNLQLPRYIVAGWGKTEFQKPSDVLLHANLQRVVCPATVPVNRTFVKLSEDYQMCAKGDGLIDTCRGDSGGPLGFTVRNVGAQFVQYGIVAAGIDSCGEESFPGIYTRVSSHMDWIIKNIRP